MKWQPGKSANPSGRPKENPEIKQYAKEKSLEALKKLYEIMTTSDDDRAIIIAANSILDRGLGKPAQELIHDASGQLKAVIEFVGRGSK